MVSMGSRLLMCLRVLISCYSYPLCKCFACVEPRNNQSDYVRYRCTLSSHVRGPVGVLRYCKVQPTRPLLYTLKSKAT